APLSSLVPTAISPIFVVNHGKVRGVLQFLEQRRKVLKTVPPRSFGPRLPLTTIAYTPRKHKNIQKQPAHVQANVNIVKTHLDQDSAYFITDTALLFTPYPVHRL
ncbi:unnamed protein product, partial [Ectocarpus sp. 12 AP-2014]